MRKKSYIFKRICAVSLTICLAFSICGCGKNSDINGDKNSSVRQADIKAENLTAGVKVDKVTGLELDDAFVNSTADFSVELFKLAVAKDLSEGKNVLLSPESISCALAMTANGADEGTRSQMENILAGGISIEDYNKYLYTYNKRLTSDDKVKFNLANSVWIKENGGIDVRDDFLEVCKNYYSAQVYKAPFDVTTKDDINSWVNYNTDGMISKLLDEIPADIVMYLINAVAFEGEWETQYKDSQVMDNGQFTDYNGNKQTVCMLNSTEDMYICDENATGFIKNYKGGKFAFMALLPNDGIDVATYVSGMSGEHMIDMYNNRSYEEVRVRIPEFTYEYDTELSEYLKAMGMQEAFDQSADFSVMADYSDYLYINRVLHKAFIQVDRMGTKAAAVTAVEIKSESAPMEDMPKSVYLTRPFVYAIIDTETGLPIFLGAVNTVK